MKVLGFSTLLLLMATISSAQKIDSGYYRSFDSTKIYYESVGKGKAVVLVHGFVVNGESWKRTALYTDLINAGYNVITFDMRGNGKSGKPHTPEAYLNDAEAKDIMGLLTELKVKTYSVVGYSRGAIIASRLLVLDKRVTKTVMGGMGLSFTDPQWPRRIMFYKALSGEPVPELEGFMKFIKSSGLDQQALAYMQNGQPSTSKEEFAKNKKPVLVICGDQDEDNGSSQELAKVIPRAVYKRTPGDHNNASRTPEFSKEILDFIK